MGATDFWSDQSKANEVVTELKRIKAQLDPVGKVSTQIEDAALLWEMASEADDHDSKVEVDGQLDGLEAELTRLETASLLSGDFDHRNCYLSIYSREGGTEAQDWTEMLLRMYLCYCQADGVGSVTEIDKTHRGRGRAQGRDAVSSRARWRMGISLTERGTHRLARVSPFNAQGKRQTSFAAVDVVPEFDDAGGVGAGRKRAGDHPVRTVVGPGRAERQQAGHGGTIDPQTHGDHDRLLGSNANSNRTRSGRCRSSKAS